ncbi:polysaccharide biosynthesis protein [Flavobacterium alkalisoli]|uniref:Polysaccharide biosynthesis protein n=1 Tax=Flavobacterium alkalisoli TaxID=2602769 RepID=A0A5B9FT26_9FLAO|nr:polysaccharide biosynthesis protein [Flavobacterium alkalisoli]QEE50150.1 polysaccharide biosynthesis protein [Flavobacterium alkalisoli]
MKKFAFIPVWLICTIISTVILYMIVTIVWMEHLYEADISNEIADSFLFKLFAEISSNTGYHTEPTSFTLFIILITGIGCGYLISKLILKLQSAY